ncbi:helix-turn-helix domain-containing protein [Nocardia sp. NPDC051990]|uniref:TetR/AcrR family transcriptional regulator n=1 Tax=Nocardia sp. NPDC051990 TaxID=3155285 RepID=UPI003423FF78
MTATGERPARGTRPANRRELIVEVASAQFYRGGFARTSISDIAEAVAMGPSALYRHFRSKQKVLTEVVFGSVDRARDQLAEATPEDLPAVAARASVRDRGLGVIWHREARYLTPEDRRTVGQRIGQVLAHTAALIRARRSELSRADSEFLASAVLAIMTGISFQNIQMPKDRLTRLVERLLVIAVDCELPDLPPAAPPAPTRPGVAVSARRTTILNTAAELFADHGFSNVGMEDIGRAVGMAGPSLYNHFAGKTEILEAAFLRGNEWLRRDLDRALAEADDETDALRRLLASYADFALERPADVRLLLTESVELPEPQGHRVRVLQHQYIAEWVQLLRRVRPGLDATTARVRVQSAIHIANDLALSRRLRGTDSTHARLLTVGTRLLELPPPD